jgi:glycosyltransferase involved in cell wall biosynthesis
VKLLLVNWQDLRNPHAGGAEIHLFELFSRLAARGHEVRLVCSGFDGGAAREVVQGITVLRTGDRHSFAWRGRAAVRAALRDDVPDVVVDDINKLPLFVAGLTDRPVYAIVPHLFGSTAFKEVAWPMAATVWAAERAIPRCYRRAWFHAISESTRDDLVARGVPADRIAVVHPGVDAAHFAPDAATPRDRPPRFVYLGRLKRYKGVDLVLRALQLARQTQPELSLDIAGSGDDRPRLERLAGQLGLGPAVRFLGFVAEATKLRLLRGATANVFPSPKEGWGITVMEASLASDSPGLRDSVRAGHTGLLVPHGDVDGLARAMLRLAGDPDLVERLGQAARHHALSHSWEAAADQVESHLRDLARGTLPPPSFSS